MLALLLILLIAVVAVLLVLYNRMITAEDLLNTFNLPFVLVCSGGRVYCNHSAKKLLKLDSEHLKARDVVCTIGNQKIRHAIDCGSDFENEFFFVGGRKISASGFNILKKGKILGYAVLFNEVTELEELKRKLDDSRELLESLRFINHDFMNRMHVLMVYLETEQWDNAKEYIGSLQSLSVSEIASVVGIIRNPSVASLILGKIKKAADAGISVNIMPDSVMNELTSGINEGEYITIIGNLIENSIEELKEIPEKQQKYIDLFVNVNLNWSVVSVTDYGRGISGDNVERVFDAGFSTKNGNNRGLGLSLVKSIAEKHGGYVEIETGPDEGLYINVVMKAEEKTDD